MSVTTSPSLPVRSKAAVTMSRGECDPCDAPLITAPMPSPAARASGAPHSAVRRRVGEARRRRGRGAGRGCARDGDCGCALAMRGLRAMPADAADFPFQHDVELGMHPAAHLFTKAFDVGGGGVAGVDEKIGV